LGHRTHVHAEHGDAAPVVAQHGDPPGVVAGEDDYTQAGVAQLAHPPLKVLPQGIEVSTWSKDVVAAGQDGDQVRLPFQGLLELFTEDVVHAAPAHSQVGVPEVRGEGSQVFGKAVCEPPVLTS